MLAKHKKRLSDAAIGGPSFLFAFLFVALNTLQDPCNFAENFPPIANAVCAQTACMAALRHPSLWRDTHADVCLPVNTS